MCIRDSSTTNALTETFTLTENTDTNLTDNGVTWSEEYTVEVGSEGQYYEAPTETYDVPVGSEGQYNEQPTEEYDVAAGSEGQYNEQGSEEYALGTTEEYDPGTTEVFDVVEDYDVGEEYNTEETYDVTTTTRKCSFNCNCYRYYYRYSRTGIIKKDFLLKSYTPLFNRWGVMRPVS